MRIGLPILMLSIMLLASPGLAQNTIFFDEFDGYGGGGSLSILSDPVWTVDACWDARVDNSIFYSGSYSAKQYKNPVLPDYIIGVRNKHVFTPAEIASIPGADPSANVVGGTDANPLRVVYLYHGKIQTDDYSRANRFVEVVCGDVRAPTGMINTTCPPDGKTRYHLENVKNDSLPDPDPPAVHGSIAIGVVAMADVDPCTPLPRQQVYRVVIYDGQYWRILKDYPTGGTNLHLCYKWNWIEMNIKSNTIDVTIMNKYNPDSVPGQTNHPCNASGSGPFRTTMTTTIDRKYLGDFSGVVMGGLVMEDLEDPADPYRPIGNCWGERQGGGINGVADYIDNVYVYDGEGKYSEADCEQPPPQGPCCVRTGWGSGTCTMTTEVDCTGTDSTWLGVGATCDDCDFCPDPFADTDEDLDVDQDDFSMFQACFTGLGGGILPGCACFDREPDTDVDQDDLGGPTLPNTFEGCASGPDVPADPTCDD